MGLTNGCTGGMELEEDSLTTKKTLDDHHWQTMRTLFVDQRQKLLTLSLCVTASVVTAICNFTNPAEARNGWVKASCTERTGECMYVKVLSTSGYPIVKFRANISDGTMSTMEAHCFRWAWRFVNDDGSPRGQWRDVMPESVGTTMLEAVCE